jgi:hypothetical protein
MKEKIDRQLLKSDNFFEILLYQSSITSARKREEEKNKLMETVISIYLMGCDLSRQNNYNNYSTILKNYKKQYYSLLTLHFRGCVDLVHLTISYL